MNMEKTLTFWIICIEHVEWVYVKLKIWPSSSSQRITGSCKGARVSFSNNGNLAQRYLGLPYFILWIFNFEIWCPLCRILSIPQQHGALNMSTDPDQCGSMWTSLLSRLCLHRTLLIYIHIVVHVAFINTTLKQRAPRGVFQFWFW